MEKNLIYNSVICLLCGETLVSRHRHDYKTCSCENATMVDGGNEYQRYGGKDINMVKSLSIYDNEPFKVLRHYIERGSRGVDGDKPLTYIKLKDIDDEYLDNLINYEEELRPNNRQLKFYRKEKKWRAKNK